MGYRGKLDERARACELRSESWTLDEIAAELAVSKSSVSVWVRDVEFVARPRNRGHSSHKPHPMKVKKEADIERCRLEAENLIGELDDRDLIMFCIGLYAGEGSKTPGTVSMANTNPVYIRILLTWLRRHFEIDESRLRMKLYLHQGLDLERSERYWSGVTDIPLSQFRAPYRAVDDRTRRHNKHVHGCATVLYSCSRTHRRLLAMIVALSSQFNIPG